MREGNISAANMGSGREKRERRVEAGGSTAPHPHTGGHKIQEQEQVAFYIRGAFPQTVAHAPNVPDAWNHLD